MSVPQRVLVALDEDHSSEGALGFALDLARNFDTQLVLATAVDRVALTAAAVTPDGALVDVQAILADCTSEAAKLVEGAAVRVNAAGARCTSEVLEGRSGPAIIDGAEAASADAIVMGTHGRAGLERLLLGSTAQAVLRMATVPTFVVRVARTNGKPAPARNFANILVAVDDSDPSDAAVKFATDLAAAKHGTLVCCHVVEQGDLTAKALTYGYDPKPILENMHAAADELLTGKTRAAAAAGVTVHNLVVEGEAAAAVLDAATAYNADLIVVGTHGRRGLKRLVMGSVAESIVQRSSVPVAVIRVIPHV